MYNIEEFSKKIKSVRIAYHLSLAEMTNLLAMKSRGPLYAWEEGKALPNLESLLGLNQYFGITLDWLVDISSRAYDAASVGKCEKVLFEQLCKNCKASEILAMKKQTGILQILQSISDARYLDLNQLDIDECGYYYFDYEPRENWSLLSARANIVFLLRSVPIEDLGWAICYLDNDEKKRGVLKKTQQYLAKFGYDLNDDYKGPGKKAMERAINLVRLLRPEKRDPNDFGIIPKKPIYDVEKTYQGYMDSDIKKQRKKLDALHKELERINKEIAELTQESIDE